MKITNPYSKVKFGYTKEIVAISHEHIFQQDQLVKAYNRGVRYFACVNYNPSCPSYPLSNWSNKFDDYNTPSDLSIITREESGSIVSFQDANGNTIFTDELVQLPNAEHPVYAFDIDGDNSIMPHFNVLGSIFKEVGWGKKWDNNWTSESMGGLSLINWRTQHPLYEMSDINNQFLNISHMMYPNKMFGTINHYGGAKGIRRLVSACPDVFKAVEAFNQGGTRGRNEQYRAAWDTVLREGIRLWGVAVVDWQGDIERGGPENMDEYIPDCDYDRGCNILLIDNYDSMTISEKSEAGLDAYIAGSYYMSGLYNHKITNLSVSEIDKTITFSVDGTPTIIKAITGTGEKNGEGNSLTLPIDEHMKYVRFEVYYKSDPLDMDFIFTNPIFIEPDNPNDGDNEDIVVKDSFALMAYKKGVI